MTMGSLHTQMQRKPGAGGLIAAICLAGVLHQPVHGQLTVTPQTNLQQLAQAISGSGVTISDPQINCHAQGFGEYAYNGTAMSLTEGVLLTTGRLTDALGPNNVGNRTFEAGTPGDPLLNMVTGRTTFDACKFEFDIIPTGDSLRFDFTLGSEEYNEWVGSQFNDVFGFFISGPGITGDPGAGNERNIALVPGTSAPVTINNVNNGSNNNYYQNNTGGSVTQYDGYTKGLYALAVVQPCQTYHLKLVVADASDRSFDSGVFIEKIESPTITLSTLTQNGTDELVEGCNPGWIRFDRGSPRPTSLTLSYFLEGTATNGADYSPIGNTNPAVVKNITIPAGQSYVDRAVNPLVDNLNEGTEFIRVLLGNPNCPSVPLDTVIFNLSDSVFTTCSPAGTICQGGSWPFTVTGGNTFSWIPAAGLSCTNCPNPVASPTSTTNYQVTVTAGTCTRTMSRMVRVSKLALSAVVTHPLCNGGSNGAINLSITGGIHPTTYAWSGPDGYTANTQDITNLQAGTYTVTVTDAGCTRTQSWNVVAPAVLGISLSPAMLPFGQNIACNGGSTGSITTVISGGTPPYTVDWSGPTGYSASSANISGLVAGTYTINVTDAQGCTASASTTLTQSPPIAFSATATAHVSCFGNNIGVATASVSGGIAPYSHSWSTVPAQTGATATGLAPGGYTVTLTDAYNCTASANVTINGPSAALATTLTSQANVACFGNATGSATIAVSGGTAPYSVSWNSVPAQSGLTASGLPAGSWTATVTDANGCQTTRTVTITQPAAALAAGIFSQTNVACFGNSSGSATVSATGGTGPYTYQWNTVPAQNTATASGLAAGSYTCTVRDVNLCQTTVNVAITGPAAALAATTSGQTNVACFGGATGSATVNASGGTAPYTYSWNTTPVQTGATATGLAAGTWTCTVTDANGCIATRNVAITQPAQPLGTSLSAQTNVGCFGNSNGSATVSGTGGTSPYTYAWNSVPAQSTATANSLSAGSYTCTVTDANGCNATRNVTITQPAAALGGSISTQTNVACFGNSTGSATMTVSGGTAPYSYSWSTTPVQTSATAAGLAAGTWTCTVTDANGCSISRTTTITQPAAALSTFIGSTTNVGCFGGNSGAATVNAAGGTAPYTYSWNTVPAQSGATATGLAAGSYTCTVTDANGCTATRSVTITQPAAAPSGSISAQTNVACFGNATGSATVNITGGTAPYTYAWNTVPLQSSATATNLPAGAWTCTVADANGCSITRTAIITQPGAALGTVLGNTTNVGCFGGSTGAATVNATGGTAPYTYSWNTVPAQSGGTATGLAAGSYTCTVTDANGCTATRSVTITQPAGALSASTSAQTNVACFGNATGSATIAVSGGTAPYTVSWNTVPPQSGLSASGLMAGNWTATVTDASGCQATRTVTITQPAAALATSITAQTNVGCFGNSNGSATVSASGGTGPYTYAWNTIPAQSGATAAGLAAGTYICTVTDANGCTSTRNITITGPAAALAATITGQTNVACSGGATGSATVSASGGTAPYTYSWNTTPVQSIATASGLVAGTYDCIVTDANGCSTARSVTITQPAAALTINGTVTPATCGGAPNGAVNLSVTGGTPPYSYAWNTVPPQTSVTAINLAAGIYTCLVTDINGCAETATHIVTVSANPVTANVTDSTDPLCVGAPTLISGIFTTGSGTTTNYLSDLNANAPAWGAYGTGYPYLNKDKGESGNPLKKGGLIYPKGILTHPGTGCPNGGICTQSWALNGATSFKASIGLDEGTHAPPYPGNGVIFHVYLDGVLTYTSPAVTVASPLINLNINTTGKTTISLGVNPISNDIGYDHATWYSARLETIIPWSITSYNWNFGAGAIPATATTAGPHSVTYSTSGTKTYSVTVTNSNGCTGAAMGTITVNSLPTPTITGPTSVCPGGSVTLDAGPGYASYSWSSGGGSGQTATYANINTTTTYTVTVMDANGCSASPSVTITQPAAALGGSISAQTNVACFGNTTGSATVTITGGTAPYTYSWNTVPLQSTATATNLPAGTWTCTVTDANGCSITRTATITQPAAALSTSLGGTTNVGCFGGSTGAATVNATGGTSPYTYAWNTVPAQNGATATGLAAGTWTCTVTDANGCTSVRSVTITQPAAALGGSISSQTNVDCFGNATGGATVTITGGTAPYTYTWNTVPPQSSATAINLPAGIWACTVTDANGCSITRSVNISQPAEPLSTSIGSTTNVDCFGNNTGSATINAIDGTAPYTYAWNTVPAQNTATATGLTAGSYTCTVTDANGCVAARPVTITQPAAALTGNISAQTNVACFGNATGSATMTVSGGTAPYSYNWNTSPVQSSATASNLAAGNWTCTVTDANGCSITRSVTITQPAAALNTVPGNTTNVDCFGGTTGAAMVNVTGGTAPYTYAWNTAPVQNSATASGLAAGTWTCTVTDANGCTATRSVTITQPAAALSGSVSAQTNVACFGNATGSATVTITGGTAPYTYDWNTVPPQSTATATSLPAGAWTCTVTDANGCSITRTATITQPAEALGTVPGNMTNVGCFGGNTGAATVNATGGTAPYTHAWNTVPAQSGATATGLSAGTWTCMVTDANGCTATLSVDITQPAATLSGSISAQTNVACFGNATGSATVNITGGTAPYTYSWNTVPLQSTATATNLPAGAWTCTVTDANGCSITRTVTITQPAAALATSITAQTNVGCFGGNTGAATVNATGGTAPYTYAWNTVPAQSAATATGLAAGTWTCTVTDANGCTSLRSATITQPAAGLTTSISAQSQVDCHDASTGSATIAVSGGTAPYIVNWNTVPPQSGLSASGLPAGNWTATVTDANGCQATRTVTIAQPAAPLAISGIVTDATCGGAANGAVNVSITGGTGPFTHAWTGPGAFTSAAEDISGLLSGAYTLSVTDANGCSAQRGFAVTQPGLFSINGSTSSYNGGWEVSCDAATDGTINQTISGGTAPYILSWSGPGGFTSSNEDLTGLGAGTYVFSLVDANGCASTATYLLEAPPTVSVSASSPTLSGGWNIACNGGATGTIDATVSGGTAPYTHAWSGPGAFSASTIDISTLVAGTFTLTSTDANGCTGNTSITLTQPAVLAASSTGISPVGCFGASNGQAGVTVTGGTAPYTHAWNTVPPQLTASATNLPAGTWTCTITDANGCSTSASAIITQPAAALGATVTAQTNVGCFGGTTGTATVNATGGTAPYAYAWSTGQNGPTATDLNAGTWTCTVTDANGCTFTRNVIITQPAAALAGSITGENDVDCFGDLTGSATATITGGTAPYTYQWNTVPLQGTATATNLPAGTWSCTVTDANGCTIIRTATITQPAAALGAVIGSMTHVACTGGNSGDATVIASGGTAPYTYAWSNGQSGATAVGLAAGTYTCTVTDANGCTTATSVTLTEPSTVPIASISAQTNVACFGDATGSATIAVSGGTAPYAVNWNSLPPQSGLSASGLPAGTWTATITDANGCQTTRIVTIAQPSAALAISGTVTPASCGDAADGAVNVSVTGGTGPLTYAWSEPGGFTSTDEDITGLPYGEYMLTVIDGNGCIADQVFTVTQPGVFSIDGFTSSYAGGWEVSCATATNGTITQSISGGTPPYILSWEGPAGFTSSNEDLTGLGAGIYFLTLEDANGCSSSAVYLLQAPPPVSVSATSSTVTGGWNIACHGSATGSIDATVSGGTAPYTHAWSGPGTYSAGSMDISALVAGTYTLTSTDINGCSGTASITLTQSTPLSASSTGISPVSCFGGSNGTAGVIVTGGTAPYTHAWNTVPPQNSANATNLPAGTWTCTVTDANGCTITNTATITQPAAALGTSIGSVTNVGCFGGSTGAATVNATGGTAPYTYAWNTVPVQNSATAIGLAAGTWTCTLTDANGCTTTRSVTITQPAATLSGSISAQTNVACFGNATGSATVTITGGTAPYAYSWNTVPLQSTATATNLPAGSWTCTVTDANGCSITRTATITQPAAALAASIGNTINAGCFGGSTGAATVNATGGTAPYTYAWNTVPAQNGATAIGLAAGSYTCTVTDANGCTATRSVTITQPAATLNASIAAQTNVACFGNATGSATVAVSGGTAPYIVNWNTVPPQSGLSASGLPAGNWTATVTDANGCQATRTVTIAQPAAPLAISGIVTDATCGGAANGAVNVSITGGTGPFTFAWTGPGAFTSAAEDISGLLSGTYTLSVTDANGCTAQRGFAVTQPGLFTIDGSTSSYTGGWEVSCAAATDGSISQTISGGTAPYILSWSGPAGFTSSNEDLTGLGAGTYVFTLVDANGCTSTATYLLEAPPTVSVSASSPTLSGGWNIACNGGATGTIDATVSGGTAPYTHAWSGPGAFSASTIDISTLVAGTFTLTSTDANGCTGNTSITLTQPAVLAASSTGISPVGCFGASNGQAGVTVTGGTAPYTHAWNTVPPQHTASATNLPAGTWTCTVTDANGCTTSATAIITQPAAALGATVTAQTNVGIFGQSTGAATVNATGGTAPYAYAWSTGQSGPTATALYAGVYSVVVTDANGCSTIVTVTITEPLSALSASVGAQSAVDCFSNATGSATVTASGGTPGYTYAWNTSPPQTTATATDLPAGTWTCTVTDANGAMAATTVTITQPASPLAANLIASVPVDCFGNSTGSATVDVSGGTTPFSLSWNTVPVQTGYTASALQTGEFTCTITDANGCTTSVDATITGPAVPLSASISAQEDVLCTGGGNGSATVGVTGGTAPHTFDWNTSPVQTAPMATGLAAGAHTCTVTDANGCTTSVQATILEPAAAISVSITGITQATCGNLNGGAMAAAAGGTAPYTFAWNSSPGQNAAQLGGVGTGTYTVTATDLHGCSATAQATVTAPDTLGIALVGTSAQTCFGVANGQATVTASGGSQPYTIAWSTSPAQSSATASGLTAGTYTATVTDGNGCTASMPVTVEGPSAALQLNATAPVNVLCHGAGTGSATVVPSGGLAPYAISWNTVPPQSGPTATGLAAGTYTATVVDAYGCTISTNVTITQPVAPINGHVDALFDVRCHGGADGSATIEATGGSGSHNITWNTVPAQSGPTATGLTVGPYIATISDANGCDTPEHVLVDISGPAGPLTVMTSTSDHLGHAISCHGGADGIINAVAAGGTPAYSYQWSGPNGLNATGSGVQDLPAGAYAVTVTDANGCVANAVETLTSPAPISASGTITAAACSGGSTGAVDVTTTGGMAPYAFAWSGPNGYATNGEDIGLVPAGVYTLTITDANGCAHMEPFNVNEPGTLSISGVAGTYPGNVNVTCAGALDGSIDATTTGGVEPYTWQWSGPNGPVSTSEDVSALGAGAYHVVATDANGCTTLGQFELIAPEALYTTAQAHVYPGGANTSCNGSNDGMIDATIGGGVPAHILAWTGPAGFSSNDEDINGLMPGTYTLTATDVNGCSSTVQATIGQPSELGVTHSVSQYNSGDAVSCSGGGNGMIDLAINGGLPPYAVNWSGPAGFSSNNVDLAGLAAGTYTAVITDAAGCDTSHTLTLTEPGPLVLSSSTSDHNGHAISCAGASDGSIDIDVSGGAGNYTYQWTSPNAFVSTDEDISDLAAGSYLLSVSDMNGCTQQLSFDLTAPDALSTTASIAGAACLGGNTGGIDITVAGGIAPYAIAWTGPGGYNATTEDIQSLFAGIYTAVITDLNGCVHSQPFAVDEPGVFAISATIQVHPGGHGVSCHGMADGAIDLTATGGTAPLFHTWQGPDGFVSTSEDISGLAAGSYNLILTDANGCSTLRSYTITSPAPIQIGPAASQFPDGSNVACAGGSNGSIDATITGGVPPYTPAWSGANGFTSIAEDITGLSAGEYILHVVDAIGCQGEASITITAPDPILTDLHLSSSVSGANVSCVGSTDGAIDLTLSGGSLLYIIQWTGPDGYASNDEDISELAAGHYQVTVTDGNGCVANADAVMTAPDPILVDIGVDLYGGGHAIPCAGSTGSVHATVEGGLQPLSYLWTGPNGFTSTDAILQGVRAGTHDLLVTDGAGCMTTASVTLTEPAPIIVTSSITDDGHGHAVTCAGDNGAIDLSVSGGTAPYIIDWTANNGFAAIGEDIAGLGEGVYTAVITDLNGCSISRSYTLTAATPIEASLVATPETCAGIGNGGVMLVATGGSGPLTYAWTGPNGMTSNAQDPGPLTHGTYTVTITDGGDCSGSWTTTVNALSDLQADIYLSNYGGVNIPCFGDSTGVIEVSVDGAAAPLTVSWSGPQGFASSALQLSGLVAGAYTVNITDGNGCSMDSTLTLTGPASAMTAALSAGVFPGAVNVACHGGNSGSIDATIIGGAGPYQFDWRGPDSSFYSTEDLTGLIAGTYTLVVTDTNSCSASATISLAQPDSTVINTTIGTFTGGANISCPGTADGSISVVLNGGTPDFDLQWSGPGGFTSDEDALDSLAAGDYLLTVTDLNGCLTMLPITLQGPTPINVLLEPSVQPGGTNISCAGLSDGTIQALITGGAPGLSHLWSGPGGSTWTTADLSGAGAGAYCLTVTDTNGCAVQQCITLTAPDSLYATTTSSQADCGLSTGTAAASVTGGSVPYAYLWSNGQTTGNIGGISTGTYALTVTDANGCIAQASAIVTGAPGLQGDGIVSNALCHGNADGIIDLTMTSGTAPYAFDWTGGGTAEDIAGLAAGSYQVQVIDAAGCTWSDVYTVGEPEPIGADSSVLVHPNGYNVSTQDGSDGSISLQATGGTAPYTYLWSNGGTTGTIDGLAAGSYSVIITDANGCVMQLTFLLDQPSELQLPTGFTPNGDGYNDVFHVRGIEGHPDNQLLVFNRWGNVVFDQLNYRNNWRGESMLGEPLPNGTYFVILRIASDDAGLQGYVDLRR